MSNTTQPQHNGQLAKPERLNLHGVWEAVEHVHNDLQQSKPQVQKGHDAPVLKVVTAIIAGCVTPLICLAMSSMAGTIAANTEGMYRLFALLPGTVLVAMLVVSTPHIAEAKETFGWTWWQAWSFAIALDLAIMVSEVADVFCHNALAGIWYIPMAVIVGSVLYSAALNSYVNLLHAKWSKVLDPRDAK